jgi:fructose-1,6-bisphosphatase/inositol monophosphatase family enzyme
LVIAYWLLEAVADLLRQVAAAELLPRFQNLTSSDVREKAPGDMVTIADERAEAALSEALQAFLPDAAIVGEEASARDGGQSLAQLASWPLAWVIDPLDGTRQFIHGTPKFGMIIALIRYGALEAGWIYDPLGERLLYGAVGHGLWLNGKAFAPCFTKTSQDMAQQWRGLVMLRGGSPWREGWRVNRKNFAQINPLPCSAHGYLALLSGEAEFLFSERLYPWDHAAGLCLYRLAGGYQQQWPGGGAYEPSVIAQTILACQSQRQWQHMANLFGI